MFRAVVAAVMVAAVAATAVAATAVAATAPAARGGGFGTRDDAVALVKRVQEKFRKDGPEATYQAITAKTREFHDRDLYAYVYDFNGKVLAHGARADLVGQNLIDFKDRTGKLVVREMVDVAQNQGSGWIAYRWTNPITKRAEDKIAYVERLDDSFVGVGVYGSEPVTDGTVGVISGSPDSDDTSLQMARDLAAVLNDGDRLRILPMVGIGGTQNVRDLIGLRGVDVALTETGILNTFRRAKGQPGGADDKVVYIAKLFNEEAHLVARSDIGSIEDLQGRKVNLGERGGGTGDLMREIFRRLNIRIDEVAMSQTEALDRIRSGEIAATVLVVGKPSRLMAGLRPADGLHFLAIPYVTSLGADYLPATLSHDDYPDMIAPDAAVDTVAVGAALVTYNWPKTSDRYRRVEKFVGALFPRIAELQRAPHHVKWREVNLAAKLPGLARFEPAEAWLARNRPPADEHSDVNAFAPPQRPLGAGTAPAPGTPALNQQQLFEEFLNWKRPPDR